MTSLQGEHGAPVRRAATAETADLLADLVAEGVRTLAFVRSRQGVESVASRPRTRLHDVDPDLADRVAPYRGGYLPEDRRALEQQLKSGELLGVAATNALELGIDIAGLDAVLMAGFPGTRASMWQQIGRSGRESQGGLGVLVARDDPLDTYLVTHPESLLGAPLEATRLRRRQPLRRRAPPVRSRPGDPARRRGLRAVRRRCRGGGRVARGRPAICAGGRADGSGPDAIGPSTSPTSARAEAARFGSSRKRPVDWSAPSTRRLPTRRCIWARSTSIWARPTSSSTTTRRSRRGGRCLRDPSTRRSRVDVTDIRIVDADVRRRRGGAGSSASARRGVDAGGRLSEAAGGDRRGARRGTARPARPSPRPPRRSGGRLTDADRRRCRDRPPTDVPGAAHAAEHASIGLLPLFATCDRWDIGGVSTALHEDTGQLTVFVYDGHPGGAGFAERGFDVARDLAGRDPGGDRFLPMRRRLPVVRAVAQMRQRQQPARQARRRSCCSTPCSRSSST